VSVQQLGCGGSSGIIRVGKLPTLTGILPIGTTLAPLCLDVLGLDEADIIAPRVRPH